MIIGKILLTAILLFIISLAVAGINDSSYKNSFVAGITALVGIASLITIPICCLLIIWS